MNCIDRDLDIALYVGGELDDALELETHLEQCARCRSVQLDLADLQSGLAGLREVELLPAAEARRAAMRQLRSRRGMRWVGIAAVAAMLCLLFIPKPKPSQAPSPPQQPIAVVSEPRPSGSGLRAKRVRPKRISRPPKASEPLVVKMFTDDPDVVILWVTD